LYNLKARHVRQLPYTRTGDIVIAVNPYHWMSDLYSQKQRQYYGQNLVWNPPTITEDPRTHLQPHVYEASCLAYKGLMRQKQNQSILVSGESGAGKTETVKILLGDIANVQKGPNSITQIGDDPIVQKVLDSNPLLEAFGNAQTLRNDNSSRFGKYLQLQFDCVSEFKCVLAGSTAEVYLLEKSRVTLHNPAERTYHIFYQLLAADEATKSQIWTGLQDTDNESFCYVGYTSTTHIEGISDGQRFLQTVEALRVIGVTGERLLTLWRALCIVLQLGNLEFAACPNNSDASVLADQEELQSLSELIGIDCTKLTTALTIRTVEARSETFSVPLTADKAKESTDAFAKEIYAKTFLWLVRAVNDATCAEKNYFGGSARGTTSKTTPKGSAISPTATLADTIRARTAGVSTPRHASSMVQSPQEFGVIGLLDIFGFETFDVNRFEQLCINYCNEKLQQKFTQDIFRSVQSEYEMEGIALDEITYDDNTDVLDLVEGKMGLLAFLNEECVRPKGSDKTFVYKAESCNKDNPCFVRAKHAKDHEFGIRHYAGLVMYDATSFVVKNMVRDIRVVMVYGGRWTSSSVPNAITCPPISCIGYSAE
jgi:myosin V